jgi:hypothetical protein
VIRCVLTVTRIVTKINLMKLGYRDRRRLEAVLGKPLEKYPTILSTLRTVSEGVFSETGLPAHIVLGDSRLWRHEKGPKLLRPGPVVSLRARFPSRTSASLAPERRLG